MTGFEAVARHLRYSCVAAAHAIVKQEPNKLAGSCQRWYPRQLLRPLPDQWWTQLRMLNWGALQCRSRLVLFAPLVTGDWPWDTMCCVLTQCAGYLARGASGLVRPI